MATKVTPGSPSHSSSSSSSSSSSTESGMEFRTVRGHPNRLEFLGKTLERIVQPKYGPQQNLLERITTGKEVACRLLFQGDNPLGVLAYKKKLSNKYKEVGVEESLAIKSMFLTKPRVTGQQNLQVLLLDKAIDVARKLSAQSLHITVREDDELSYPFLLQQKFTVVKTSELPSGVKTHLLFLRLSGEAPQKETQKVESGSSSLTVKKGPDLEKTLKQDQDKEESTGRPPKRKREEALDKPLGGTLLAEPPRERLPTKSDKAPEEEGHYSSSKKHRQYQAGERYSYPREHRPSSFPSDHRGSYSSGIPTQSPYGSLPRRESSYQERGRWSDDRSSASRSSSDSRGSNANRSGDQSSRSAGSSKFFPMTLKNQYLQMIKRGEKTIEGRINNGIFATRKVGDCFRFYNQNDSVNCEITKVATYKSFKDMLEKEGYKSLVPNERSLEAAINAYTKIPGYADKAAKFGVIALHIKKVD